MNTHPTPLVGGRKPESGWLPRRHIAIFLSALAGRNEVAFRQASWRTRCTASPGSSPKLWGAGRFGEADSRRKRLPLSFGDSLSSGKQ